MGFLKSRTSNEKTRRDDQAAANDDLHDGKPESHFEIVIPDVGNRDELDADHDVGQIQSRVKMRKEEGECVEYSANEGHSSDDNSTHHGVSAPRVFSRIRKCLRKSHTNSSTNCGRRANEECNMRILCSECRRKKWRKRRYGTIHETDEPWLHNSQEE